MAMNDLEKIKIRIKNILLVINYFLIHQNQFLDRINEKKKLAKIKLILIFSLLI